MPVISIWVIRAALLYFCAGFGIGALLLWHKGAPSSPFLWVLLPAHMEFLLVGWIIQLALGVAYWILPRRSKKPRRGPPVLVIGSLLLLNAGIIMVGAAPLVAGGGELSMAGRVLELLGVGVFVSTLWPRIRAARS